MRQHCTEIPAGRIIVLKGKEAEAFMKDAAKPPTITQVTIVRRALEEFGASDAGH